MQRFINTLIYTITFLTIWNVPLTSQQNPKNDSLILMNHPRHNPQVEKLFKTRVKYIDKQSQKGFLLEANDSMVVLTSSEFPHRYFTGEYVSVNIPVSQIRTIVLNTKADFTNSQHSNTMDGIAETWKNIDMNNSPPDSKEQFYGCMITSFLYGCLVGNYKALLAGSDYQRFDINGHPGRYREAQKVLQIFSAYIE